MFGNQLRLERPVPITRNLDGHRAVVRQHALLTRAIAMIRSGVRFGPTRRVPEVVTELAPAHPLHQRLLQPASCTPHFRRFPHRTSGAFHTGVPSAFHAVLQALSTPVLQALSTRTSSAFHACTSSAFHAVLQALSTPYFKRSPRRTSSAFHAALQALSMPYFKRPSRRTSSACHLLFARRLLRDFADVVCGQHRGERARAWTAD